MQKSQPINIHCEKCKTGIPIPVKMPEGKELIKLLKNKYNYKKPTILNEKTFIKLIHRSYIRFQCPNCKWEKMTQVNELMIQGFINANICKNCELDLCLWVNCGNGGYIKNDI